MFSSPLLNLGFPDSNLGHLTWKLVVDYNTAPKFSSWVRRQVSR